MMKYLPMILVSAYFIIINLAGYITCADDKSRAKAGDWRIPEKRFFIIAALGGSVGVLLGMYHFHHKTLHKRFTIGIPAILVIQIVLIVKFVILK